jgi:predicted GNAT superfamily acetyltransferase
LKWHQRAWALERGIDTVVWTFDPLVRRNAVVNLVKLGVDVEEFAPDFYGQMEDAINADDASDRLFATWRLASVRVERAIGGDLARIDVEAARVDGRDLIAIPIPDDIVALRSTDRREAAMWRQRMRTALTTALADGYVLVGITTDDGYALERR